MRPNLFAQSALICVDLWLNAVAFAFPRVFALALAFGFSQGPRAKSQWPDLDFAFGFGFLITRACFKNIFHFSFKALRSKTRTSTPSRAKTTTARAGDPGLRARLRQRGKEDFSPYLRGLKTARHDFAAIAHYASSGQC